MSKHTVFIIGATGKTGTSIADVLLEDPSFQVIAAVRASSISKPEVASLKRRGAEIKIIDFVTASPQELEGALSGAKTVISTVLYTYIPQQKQWADAAKKAGVERFIPCDWGTACVPGLRKLFDEKNKVQEYIKSIGIGYTFIDVGWWMQLTLPILDADKADFPMIADWSKYIFGSAGLRNAVTDKKDIGKFVSRIIKDDRTLNRYVFCWAEEVTQSEIIAIAERVTGKTIPTKHIDAEELLAKAGIDPDDIIKNYLQYQYSIWVRGDNTVAKAKEPEYGQALDARELYPDLELNTLAEYAKEFYA